jgi:xylan 1,4-beta-xylosidase
LFCVFDCSYTGNNPPSDNLVQALTRYLGQESVTYASGGELCGASAPAPGVVAAAVSAAEQADAVVITIGNDGSNLAGRVAPPPSRVNTSLESLGGCLENEGTDRVSIAVPQLQLRLLSAVLNATQATAAASDGKGKPVIVVVFSGGPVDLTPLKEAAGVSAILWAGFPAAAGGSAIAATIFGDNAPAGRLTQTFYNEKFLLEVPITNMAMRPGAGPNGSSSSPGRGYRFYTGENVVYPFGFGLTYSTFSLLSLSADAGSANVSVANTGGTATAYTTLLFIAPPLAAGGPAAGHPRRLLASYRKEHYAVGEQKSLVLPFSPRALELAQVDGSLARTPGVWTAAVEELNVSFTVS